MRARVTRHFEYDYRLNRSVNTKSVPALFKRKRKMNRWVKQKMFATNSKKERKKSNASVAIVATRAKDKPEESTNHIGTELSIPFCVCVSRLVPYKRNKRKPLSFFYPSFLHVYNSSIAPSFYFIFFSASFLLPCLLALPSLPHPIRLPPRRSRLGWNLELAV